MPWVIIGAVPTAWVTWTILNRHRLGALVAASRLVVAGAAIFAIEHAVFATTCAAEMWCPVPHSFFAEDHIRLHVFMAGIYTAVGAGALMVVARTLLREGRRAGWFTVLGALVVGGTLEIVLASTWFSHALAEDVTVGESTFEDLAFMILYTYLVAWSAALAISYRAIFKEPATSSG